MAHVLSEERHDEGRLGEPKATRRSASATVVDDSCHVLEEPLVGAVVDEHHTIIAVPGAPQFAPAPGDYQSCADRFRGRENHLGQPFWVIDDNAAEADVDGGWPFVEKFRKLGGRGILWFFAEKEPTDIWSRVSSMTRGKHEVAYEPMKSGQSTGVGIKPGDQQ